MVSILHSDINPYPLTTVIATLGGDSLIDTIESLNMGTVVPDEILICIPVNESHKVKSFNFPNVKIIVTDKRGQVFQRLVGFKNATHNMVMQLDDDIFVDKNCVKNLTETLTTEGPMTAVGPCIIVRNRNPIEKRNKSSKLLAFFNWLINGEAGYVPGAITLSGVPLQVDLGLESKRTWNVEWPSWWLCNV